MVLAAGAGARFGEPKQLAVLRGRPLLEHSLRTLAGSALERRLVVLGSAAERILAEVDLHGAEPVVCEEWKRGQAASLAAGIRAASGAEAVVIILGDQPLISPAAIERVIGARGWGAVAVRATYGGAPGHPVLLEHELFASALRLRGDAGARALLEDHRDRVRDVPCDGLGSPADVDTPASLVELEAPE
jgi:CTP:molybdopterin cytidylyltransferase MocA